MASLRVMGLWPRSRARTGSDVTMTVPSTFSMNIAHATINGTMNAPKARGIGRTTGGKAVGIQARLWHRVGNRCCQIGLKRQHKIRPVRRQAVWHLTLGAQRARTAGVSE